MKEEVYLTLGSNVEREYYYPLAVRKLAEMAEIAAVSPVYETRPVGMAPDTGPFFNGAVLVLTNLEPEVFKTRLIQDVENALDRVRPSNGQWTSRTIDVDIAIWGEVVGEILGRRVPDPGIRKYIHLALPLADIAPDLELPGQPQGQAVTLSQIADRLVAAGALPRRRDDIILKY
jgi:2-amino-4-hydroxy-6-hydroxymethyldihydropteridine diphosphokinase